MRRAIAAALLLAASSARADATTPAPAPATPAAADEIGDIVVRFLPGSAKVRASDRRLVDRAAELLLGQPRIGRVRIEGYTPIYMPEARDLRLARARAEAVRRALRRRGVRAERLGAEAFAGILAVPDGDGGGWADCVRFTVTVLDGRRIQQE